jgi:hypothetical protein
MSDLGAIHISPSETNNTGKIVGAIIVALAVCALGVYGHQAGMWNSPPKEAVPYSDLPSPGVPVTKPPATGP